MHKTHNYKTQLQWTGNKGSGTSGYKDYDRSHTIHVEGKEEIWASSDPSFRGDPTRYNPEEMLLASLSSCHMLWYLHLCAVAGVVVTEYTDNAQGVMEELRDGSGRFTEATLFPIVKVAEEKMIEKAIALHDDAHKKCFIANSVNFPLRHEITCLIG